MFSSKIEWEILNMGFSLIDKGYLDNPGSAQRAYFDMQLRTAVHRILLSAPTDISNISRLDLFHYFQIDLPLQFQQYSVNIVMGFTLDLSSESISLSNCEVGIGGEEYIFHTLFTERASSSADRIMKKTLQYLRAYENVKLSRRRAAEKRKMLKYPTA